MMPPWLTLSMSGSRLSSASPPANVRPEHDQELLPWSCLERCDHLSAASQLARDSPTYTTGHPHHLSVSVCDNGTRASFKYHTARGRKELMQAFRSCWADPRV